MSKRMEGVASTQGLARDIGVGEAVIFAVAEAEGVSPLDLTPLTDVVDPDALNDFIESLGSKQTKPTGLVEFEYRGHDIRVTADGAITVDENDRK